VIVRAAPGAVNIYASSIADDGSFGPAVLVPELGAFRSTKVARPSRRDGLEIFIPSNGIGLGSPNDIWVSTREETSDTWPIPVNLGPPVNTQFAEGGPALSWDATTLYFLFGSSRADLGLWDLYVTTPPQVPQAPGG